MSNSLNRPFSEHTQWIWSVAKSDWVMLRRSFLVSNGCQSASLKITAAYHYIAYVNGHVVGRGPGRSYDFAKSYDEIDIFPYLKPGSRMVVAVLALANDRPGLIAEVTLADRQGNPLSAGTDASWKAAPHLAFARDTVGYAIPLGREEQFDVRLEVSGWTEPYFDDSSWEYAAELGGVPWTRFEPSAVGLLSQDPIYPRGFTAIELARLRPGYRFRLYSPSEFMKVFATEITCAAPAHIRLFFKSGEPKVAIDGQSMEATATLPLTTGVHLLCCCQLGYGAVELEVLIATEDTLSFSAAAISGDSGAEWAICAFSQAVVRYPWHETAAAAIETHPAVKRLLTAPSAAALPADLKGEFRAAASKPPSAYLDVITQQYYRVPGGHTLPLIDQTQPRLTVKEPIKPFFHKPNHLLHQDVGAALILPTDGFDTHFIVDFGCETIGYVQLTVDAPDGMVIDVQCFELIDGRGIAWMENHNGFRYICREGLQTFTSHYRRGFRYVSVTLRGCARPVKFYNLHCLRTAYPIHEVGSFECSDWELNQIYRMSVNTASLCMLDTYVDCPGHEQNFWVGDARITALINLLTFGAYDLNQRSIRLVGQSLSAEWVRAYFPDDERYTSGNYMPIAAFPNYPEGGLPMWTFLWILQCWEHYLYGGDRDHLVENFGYVAETLRRCRRLTNERGLLDIPGAWNLIEWGNNDLSAYGEVTANNVLLVRCLECAALMAAELGSKAQADEYRDEAEKRKSVINRLCWDEARHGYVDTVRDEWGYLRYLELCRKREWEALTYEDYCAASRISEQTNTLALICACVPEERREAVWSITKRPQQGRYRFGAPSARTYGVPTEQEAPGGIVAVGSPFFLFFSLEAFFQQENVAGALEIIRRDWGKMAERGTQTCWETFEWNETTWTRSVAHAWSAAPAVYLLQQVLGVQPLEPGFRKFTVQPRPGDLRWARGSVATPVGPIFVSWKRADDGAVEISVSAPAGCVIAEI
jgi:hypothetical protein